MFCSSRTPYILTRMHSNSCSSTVSAIPLAEPKVASVSLPTGGFPTPTGPRPTVRPTPTDIHTGRPSGRPTPTGVAPSGKPSAPSGTPVKHTRTRCKYHFVLEHNQKTKAEGN